MPVQTVFESLDAGMSLDDITEVFDVTPDEIKAVLHFASQSFAKAPSFADENIVRLHEKLDGMSWKTADSSSRPRKRA
jgi:hypothetical protein